MRTSAKFRRIPSAPITSTYAHMRAGSSPDASSTTECPTPLSSPSISATTQSTSVVASASRAPTSIAAPVAGITIFCRVARRESRNVRATSCSRGGMLRAPPAVFISIGHMPA